MTCPVPSQPGVGHLISRFSGLEGSKDCGERAEGSTLVNLERKKWKEVLRMLLSTLPVKHRETFRFGGYFLESEAQHWKFPKLKSVK